MKGENFKVSEESRLSNCEMGYLTYAMKGSVDTELKELLTSLNHFGNGKTILSVLKAYAYSKM